jgi:hypothetical protein
MSKEYGRDLEEHLLDEHWWMVNNKTYPKFKGVWEKRFVLPTTYTRHFNERTEEQPLEIPLVGGGFIRLGINDQARPDIAVDIKFPTARGDEEMREEEFIITDERDREPYPFNIFYDGEDQDERMKFLARMNPEKDIDWEKLHPESDEYEIAQALCKYKEFESEPRKYIFTTE